MGHNTRAARRGGRWRRSARAQVHHYRADRRDRRLPMCDDERARGRNRVQHLMHNRRSYFDVIHVPATR
jgi:hypothetical protein